MKLMFILVTSTILSLITSCAHFYSVVDPNYSNTLHEVMQKHEGQYYSGQYGVYDYRAYPRSVALKARTGVVRVYEVHVFDLDQDGRFDTVFSLYDGKWKFGTTKALQKNARTIDSGLSYEFIMQYLNIATDIKQSIIRRKAIDRAQRAVQIKNFVEKPAVSAGTIYNTWN